ncbi:hypothetical protein E2562_020016 [Oryza meyeriana var. granulata]|uniref:Uncharacterized protein n=1 Tax=Oryza meyeriana var. granulata TaxID=110450 RepID=A0A6G1FAN3_9ORYZ|nr:hypothetical protein E2562_020016 [Oryza meyeriana var. granulata]
MARHHFPKQRRRDEFIVPDPRMDVDQGEVPVQEERAFKEKTQGRRFTCLARDHHAITCKDLGHCFSYHHQGHRAHTASGIMPPLHAAQLAPASLSCASPRIAPTTTHSTSRQPTMPGCDSPPTTNDANTCSGNGTPQQPSDDDYLVPTSDALDKECCE